MTWEFTWKGERLNKEKRFTNVSQSKTFNNLVSLFELNKKGVLDLGCSYGEYLAHFGPGSIGITNEEEEVEFGRQNNLTIKNINLDTDIIEGTFDVVFANNIFEHVFSPHQFLQKIKKNIKENGILILGVPCVPLISPLIHLNKFRGSLHHEHINFFNKHTLRLTAEYAGYEIITERGYHFKNPFIDHLLDPIYPHFFCIARLKAKDE